MAKKEYKIEGMHCASCAAIIERKFKNLEGVKDVSVSYALESVQIDAENVSIEILNKEIEPLGYKLYEEKNDGVDSLVDGVHEKTEDSEHAEDLMSLKKHVLISIPIVIVSIFVMAWEALGREFGVVPMMGEIAKEFFHHLLPILATYMMFVVGKPYLLGFWRFLKYRQANMDTLIGIGTLTAYLYSFVVSAFEGVLGPYLDVEVMYYDVTIVVIGFITLGKYLEIRAKTKTSDALKSLLSLQAKSAIVRRGNDDQEVPISDIKVGDLVVVKSGTKIPVDGVVNSGMSYVNESMITGEPMPVLKQAGDSVTSGTINQDGMLLITARAVGKDSLLSHIIDLVKAAQSSKAPIQKLADRVSEIFVPVVLVIALLSLLSWIFIGGRFMPLDQAIAIGITSFVGVLVIACPCALGLATPTAIIVGVGKGASGGILIKNAEALEKLSKVRHIVFDKTGTITMGRPTVASFKNLGNLPDKDVISLAASVETGSEHPLALSITNYAKERNISFLPISDFQIKRGLGASAMVSDRKIFVGNDIFIRQETGFDVPLAEMASELEHAHTPVVVADQNQVLGYFFIGDLIKTEAKEAIANLHRNKVKSHMATGDVPASAEAVAKEVGIDSYYARLLPEDKQVIVRDLKKDNSLVAVAGDGVNDAPAMALADVGIAMATGTDVAIETADITLLGGDIGKIADAIRLSHDTLKTIKQNLFWAFAFNVLGIPLAAGAFYSFGLMLSPAFAGAAMAFSSVLVVSNSLKLKLGKL